jgi:hypothetical protein
MKLAAISTAVVSSLVLAALAFYDRIVYRLLTV